MCNVKWRRSGKKKERQVETQFTTKIDGKTSLGWVPVSYFKN
jgi:hypothetical protein